jgi:hypothetical protein
MMLLSPEFSPTVNVNFSVSADAETVVVVSGAAVVSVVDEPPHDVNAKAAMTARANFFMYSVFQSGMNTRK